MKPKAPRKRISDPTRTLTLRARGCAAVNARFDAVGRAVVQALLLGDFSPKEEGPPVLLVNDSQFDYFVQSLVDKHILETDTPLASKFLSKPVGQAYGAGARASASAASKALARAGKGLAVSLNSPGHLARAESAYRRTYNDLKGWSDSMRNQMARVVSEGILKGATLPAIAREITKVTDATKLQARRIARTEIARANQEGAAIETLRIASDLNIDPEVIWHTCMDGHERPTHAARNKQVYPVSVALGLLGEPNCRCSICANIPNSKKVRKK